MKRINVKGFLFLQKKKKKDDLSDFWLIALNPIRGNLTPTLTFVRRLKHNTESYWIYNYLYNVKSAGLGV